MNARGMTKNAIKGAEKMLDVIEENGLAVSRLNGDFHEYIRAHGLVSEVPLKQLASTRFLRDYEYPVNSWPFFVSPGFVEQMRDMNASMLRLMHKAIRSVFGRDAMRMSAAMNMDPVLCAFMLEDIDFANVCFRTDAILTDDGLKLVEINVGTSIGGWQIQWADEVFRRFDGFRRFFDLHDVTCRNTPVACFRFLIESAAKIAPTDSEPVNILMKVKSDFDVTIYGDVLEGYLGQAIAEAGRSCRINYYHSLDELDVRPEGTFHNGIRAHLVCFGDLSRKDELPRDLLRCVLAGKLACPDFPTYGLLSDKRNMALLHYAVKNRLFTDAEARLVERYVPRTFILGGPLYSPDVRDQLLTEKDRFVVKQCNGMQGIDIHVGRFISEQQWSGVIANLDRPELWIAQEYCTSKKFYGHAGESRGVFNFVWGVFQFGNHFGGSWIRMMQEGDTYDGVINSARGAQERIVFEAAY